MKKTMRLMVALLVWTAATLSALAADYTTFLTTARGFTEVTTLDGIVSDPSQCYLLTAAEDLTLFVGIGRYEEKPSWAGDDTKALRYRQTGDPVADLSNFFTIEKAGDYIGLRNLRLNASLFQTHDNAGYMYVLTYTEPTMSDWCYLKPTWHPSTLNSQLSTNEGYWLFESGKYPMSSNNWACGYLGPWNKLVKADEPIALNRRNTAGDEAGHYRLWRISRDDLQRAQQAISNSQPADMTWKIQNPSFELGETGWTLNGKNPEGNKEFTARDYGMSGKQGQLLMNAYQWWAQSLSVSQTVTGLPAGEYDLSGVVATWQGRTVSLSANGSTVSQSGQGDGTGIRVTTHVTVGTDGRLTITCGSTAQWWVAGHEGETQTFFKLDDVQLSCTSLALDAMAVPLPNNEMRLVPGQWYYYETDYSTEFQLIGPVADIVYTTDGSVSCSSATGAAASRTMTLPVGRTYFKTSANNATLVIMPYRNVEEGTFTAVALNVDGLPNKIATYDLNPDGPGRDGTLKISQYLASKGYDFIGCSEDFNYNGALMESLNGYSCGTIRNTLSAGDLDYWQLIQGKIHVDTDGLNLLWKNSKISATGESWTGWWDTESTDGNQYVEKGYRYYNVTIDGRASIDVFILHMDAGDTNATWSRESQWRQLADAINSSDHTRGKLIIGDTNSRYTRENVITNFFSRLSSDFTANDVWVEKYRNGIYPTTDMDNLADQSDIDNYSNYEIVDKIICINPKTANTVRLTPQTFSIQHDYTYGYVDGTADTTPLGDHHPVVVQFKWQLSADVTPTAITLADASDNTTAISNANGVLANVTLQGRTLYKDGSWNTLCLPFSMTTEQVAAQLAPTALMELDTKESGLDGTTLYLYFKDATAINAGTPYIIKWNANSGDDLVNPVFRGVTVTNGSPAEIESEDGAVTFKGTYAPAALNAVSTNLYLGTNNTLYYPAADGFKVNAFRAYFQLSEPTANTAREFILRFGDETTGFTEGRGKKEDVRSKSGYYNLQGRRVTNLTPHSTLHTPRTIIIQNGKKVITH